MQKNGNLLYDRAAGGSKKRKRHCDESNKSPKIRKTKQSKRTATATQNCSVLKRQLSTKDIPRHHKKSSSSPGDAHTSVNDDSHTIVRSLQSTSTGQAEIKQS